LDRVEVHSSKRSTNPKADKIEEEIKDVLSESKDAI
jgi:hypothetical protein